MEMIEIKTAELIGSALDWAVAKSDNFEVFFERGYPCYRRHLLGEVLVFSPSTDWAKGGPLIEKFILDLKFCVFELPNESWKAETHESWANGSTALIASMRAIVHANFGDTVSVPKELMQ